MAPSKRFEVIIAGDHKGLSSALGDAEGALGKFGNAAKKVAKATAVAFAAIGAGAVVFGKQAVDAASNLEESLSKVNVVFGEQSEEIKKWAAGSAKAFGQSKQSALEAAGTYGNLFQAFGLGRDESADMSKSLVELAADLASFNNTSVDDALLALRSGLSGETEPLKRFGVAINDARLKEEALKLGLIKTTKEALTPGAKAAAAYALIMKDTTLAQGDFARTSDGLANKQRIAGAQWEDLKAKIGTGLLPAMTGLMSFISDKAIPTLSRLSDEWMPKVREAFAQVQAKVEEWWPAIKEAFEQIWATVQEIWPDVQRIIVDVAKTVGAVIAGVVEVVTVLWENFGNNILTFVQRVWPNIQQVISGVLESIRSVIQVITSLIQGDWSGVWEGLKGIVSGAWNAIQGIIKAQLEVIYGVIGIAGEIIGSLAKGMWDGIKNAFKAVINWIIDAWNGLEFKIPGFDPPGPGPKFGGFTLGVPDIPRLAEGGIVTRPTLALIGEGRGPEAVIPLDRAGGFGGLTVNFNGPVSSREEARAGVVEGLAEYVRRNGASDIRRMLGL